MRLVNYIIEGEKNRTALALKNVLLPALKDVVKKCSQYFDEVSQIKNNPFIYRGVHSLPVRPIEMRLPRKDRVPKDTPVLVHNIMDEMLYDEFGWKPRSTGVFTSAEIRLITSYGPNFIFVPSNGYKYIWCTKQGYDDMYAIFDHQEYDPDFYESQTDGVWKSPDFRGQEFDDIKGVDKFMNYHGFTHYVTGYEVVTYEHNKTKEMSKWILVNTDIGGDNSKEALQKATDVIMEKGADYVKYCLDIALTKAIREQSPAEIMFKCKYYYLIDVKLTGALQGML